MRITIDDGILLNIADAIRKAEGSDEKIKVTDYADRIEALEEIGGGSALSDNIYVADFSPLVPTGKIHLEHNLGKTPYFVGIFTNEKLEVVDYWWESVLVMPDSSLYVTGASAGMDTLAKKNAKGTAITITESDCDIDFSVSSYCYNIKFKITDYTIIMVC